jgi:FAD-dependent oxidoreductase domain-containing protein 1
MGVKRKVIIVGGGAMGSAIASFLAEIAPASHDITVIERDSTYRQASSALSAAGVRQQFSTGVNIDIAAYGAWFLKHCADILAVGDERPDPAFREDGYLLLAPPGREAVMRANHAIQRAKGADNLLLSPDALKKRFPWINPDDVALGSLGLSGEGWFDGYGLLQGFRKKARACGVRYLEAEVDGFVASGGGISAARLKDGTAVQGDVFILAAGAWSAPLAASVGIALPVSARRRSVFAFQCRQEVAPCPLVVDITGAWFRPEGRSQFIAGISPDDDPEDLPLEVNHAEWDDIVWPALASRVPAFEAVKVTGSWAGYYEYNTLDQNGVIGPHDVFANLIFCTGFSGHGMMQSPAAGRAVAELVAHGRYVSIDVSELGWERIRDNSPHVERNVI